MWKRNFIDLMIDEIMYVLMLYNYECVIQWSSYCCKYLTVVDIPGFQKTIEWRDRLTIHHGKINVMNIEVKWLWLWFDYDSTTLHHIGIHIMKIGLALLLTSDLNMTALKLLLIGTVHYDYLWFVMLHYD